MVKASSKQVEKNFSVSQEYFDWVVELKQEIRSAQFRASLTVNKELVQLYWKVGKSILAKQEQFGWGAKIIDKLSKDIAGDFPGTSGFSPRNLKYMRKFASIYPDKEFVQAVLAQILGSGLYLDVLLR